MLRTPSRSLPSYADAGSASTSPTGRLGTVSSVGSQGSCSSPCPADLTPHRLFERAQSGASFSGPQRAHSFEARTARRSLQLSGKEPSTRWGWLLLCLALTTTLLGGISLMHHHQYSHIHDHIDAEYNAHVEAWQASELTEFHNTNWMLIVDDQHIVDLTRSADATQTPRTVMGRPLRRNMTTHVAFSVGSLIPLVFFPTAEAESDRQADPSEWQPVKPEMYAHQNFRLKGVHEASGATSWVTLDDYPFVRRAEVIPGLKAGECQRRDGLFDPHDNSCTLMEFLSEVCIRVAVDTMSPEPHYYDVDHTHKAAGCYPEDGLTIPQYLRLPLGHHHVEGEGGDTTFYLPHSARTATRMVVRHAHDPELMEKVLKFELLKLLHVKRILFNLGAVMVLVSLLLLVLVGRRGAPAAAKRVARKLYLRWRYPNSRKEDEAYNFFRAAPMAV